MMRKYYDINEEDRGNGNPVTNDQRQQWNSFLDDLHSKGNIDLNNPGIDANALNKYKENNPNFSITPDLIPSIQHEQEQLRNGPSFGGLNSDQLNSARSGMSSDFLNAGDLNKSYYPVFKRGSEDFGTDIERYAGIKTGLAPIVSPVNSPADSISGISNKTSDPIRSASPSGSEIIPLPDFNSSKSRAQYAAGFVKKYGSAFQGYGDLPLNVNQVPRAGSDTMKNIATDAAKKYGIDPALLFTSSMVEGASGLFKSQATGLDSKNRKSSDFGYQDYYGDKQFPINGNGSFGLPDFAKRFPELVSGGYLPKEFQSKFRGTKNSGEFSENDFKTPEDAMQAKAALMKFGYDYVDKVAKKNNVELSPAQRDFFSLAFFNGGEGAVNKRIPLYSKLGYLKDDNFINNRPKEEEDVKGTYKDVWGHVAPRLKMRDAFKEQQLF